MRHGAPTRPLAHALRERTRRRFPVSASVDDFGLRLTPLLTLVTAPPAVPLRSP